MNRFRTDMSRAADSQRACVHVCMCAWCMCRRGRTAGTGSMEHSCHDGRIGSRPTGGSHARRRQELAAGVECLRLARRAHRAAAHGRPKVLALRCRRCRQLRLRLRRGEAMLCSVAPAVAVAAAQHALRNTVSAILERAVGACERTHTRTPSEGGTQVRRTRISVNWAIQATPAPARLQASHGSPLDATHYGHYGDYGDYGHHGHTARAHVRVGRLCLPMAPGPSGHE